MVRNKWRGAGLWVALFMCAGSFIGLSATDAFAVAGKMTGAPPGATALSGGSVTIELDEPVHGQREFTSTVGPNGEVDFPAGVDPNKGSTCRYSDGKGNTVTFRCGGYFAMGGGAAAGASNVAAAAGKSVSFLKRLADSWIDIQGGYSIPSGINSTSTGTSSFGGSPFLQGSGANDMAGPSYNFSVRHPLDRFRPMLGGGAPYLFVQGSKFHGLEGTGGVGVSSTGMDRASVTRELNYAVGGGIGFSFPVYCLDGIRGGDQCFEAGGFVGGKVLRQRVSAVADEAGNVRTFDDCFSDAVPFGGIMLGAPIVKGVRLTFTWEAMAMYSRELGGQSFFNNDYRFRSDGGVNHNLWGGLSFNLGKMLF